MPPYLAHLGNEGKKKGKKVSLQGSFINAPLRNAYARRKDYRRCNIGSQGVNITPTRGDKKICLLALTRFDRVTSGL